MHIEMSGQPAYTMAVVSLDHDESVFCEPGAMVALSAGIQASGSLEGGVVRAAMRRVLGDEDFFLGRYTATVHGAWVALAPRFPGDIAEITLGQDVAIQSGSMLAFSSGITLDVRYAGLRNILLREGATVLRASGTGTVLISSYGALRCMALRDGESVVVDTGHLVAWTLGMDVRIGPLSGVVSQALTGEGLVARVTGPGRVWLQTRAEQGMRDWILPERGQNSA